MKEAPITHSPHAFVPKPYYTEKEKAEMYKTRIDETFRPYTVIDVITKVFHRSFSEDLRDYLGSHPPRAKGEDDWKVDRIWVNGLKIVHSEALFEQRISNFIVEIETDCRLKIEEVRAGNSANRSRYSLNHKYWLRYIFDFRPCELNCHFDCIIDREENTLLALNPHFIRADKYLLPVLGKEDYARIAYDMLRECCSEALAEDVPVDTVAFARRMEACIYYGKFPDNGTLGEFFFGFGTAQVVDERSGEVKRACIKPGSIVLNAQACKSIGTRNTTIIHECSHGRFDFIHFMLQKMHGLDYCSYVCKRFRNSDNDRLSPIDLMEIQANTLPGYILIRENTGKKHAEELLDSYGGERNPANMRRLVDDMAAYYGTTKHLARTRLMDFGFNEVRGIMQSANGALVPSYISGLKEGQTHTISEADALKEFVVNDDFRETLLSGNYVYVEGHYCLDDRKYICYDQMGYLHLTVYAREHMDECCLVFEIVYHNTVGRIINGVVQKGIGKGRKEIKYVKADGSSPVTEEGRKLRAQMDRERAMSFGIFLSFNDLTVQFMKKTGMTENALVGETGLSRETIKNMRNDPTRMFSIQEVVAVCIAFHLAPEDSERYIAASPCKFMNTTDMRLYRYALHYWYMDTVAEANRKLVEAGAQPLTNLVDGFDEKGVKMG